MLCKKCMTVKTADAFYISNKTRCKDCVKADVKANRIENIERIRAYDRLRASQPHRMANNFKQSQAWRKAFPNRRPASNASE